MLRLAPDQQRELRETADSHADDAEQEAGACFSTLAMLGENARYMGEAETSEAYDQEITDLLEGNAQSLLAATDVILREHGMAIVDRITAEIAQHIGIDVGAALALAITLDSHAVIEDQDRALMLVLSAWTPSDAPMPLNAAWLAPSVQWQPGKVVVELPQTLALAAVGKPLRDTLTHPVLDRHPLTVTGVGTANGDRMTLEVDADVTPLETEALIAMRRPAK